MVTNMNNKLLKLLVLSICVVLLFGLVACKGDTTKDDNTSLPQQNELSNDTETERDNNKNETVGNTSGIELEEDVFGDDIIVDNASSNTSSTNKPAEQNNQSNNQSSNNSSDNSQDTPSTDGDSTSEEDNTSSDEQPTESDDGTVKLPVDWF